MNKKISFFCLLVLAVSLWFPIQSAGDEIFTLESAIDRAVSFHPLMKAAFFDVDAAGLSVKHAQILRDIPQMDLNFFTGIAPEARGSIFYSPDKSDDLDTFGPFYRFSLELIKPISTFGRMSSAVETARQMVCIEKNKADSILADLSLEVIKSYWGLSSASKAVSLAVDLKDNYDRFLEQVRERLEDEKSAVDDADLFEVKTFGYTVEEIYQESIKLKILAANSFHILLNLDLNEEVVLTDQKTPRVDLEQNRLREFIRMAEELRPEVRGLKSAIDALSSQIRFQKSKRFPVFFLAAGLGYARAPSRVDQTNPFVLDEFNYRRLGAALGLNWNPNLFVHSVEIQKARVEQNAALEKLNALISTLGIEVSEALAEVKKTSALLESARQSLDSAKSWLRVCVGNWEMGLGEVWRMLRAYEAYFRLETKEIETEYLLKLSLARLAHVMGDVHLYVKWMNNGKVTFE
jgi:outer membrane protein